MSENKRHLKVFLSYASQDKSTVQELSQRLGSEEWIDPWVDNKKLLPGQDWRTKIEEAVETSDIVIICISNNSVSKEGFVQKELRYAREISFEKPDETIFLVPLRLDDCTVPRGLRFYQWADYFGENKEDTYISLIESLKIRHEQKLKLLEKELVQLEKEQQERELAQRIAREKAEQEFAERTARKEAERIAREKAKHEADENAKKEKLARQIARKDTIEKFFSEKFFSSFTAQLKPFFRIAGIIGVVLALLGGGSLVIPQLFLPTPTIEATNTQPPVKSSTSTKISVPPSNTPKPTVLPTSTPIPTALPTEIVDAEGVPMILVPSGKFVMGSNEGNADESPAHLVDLDTFYMDKYEVSVGLFRECVAEKGCIAKTLYCLATNNDKCEASYPMVRIDWYDAAALCKWRGSRLPTEAEWEKAARGVDERLYPWGNEIDDAIYSNSTAIYGGQAGFERIGYSSGISPYGIYDMAGNVWEWVADRYVKYYYSYSESINPQGPENGSFRVLRGGSYSDTAFSIRTTYRRKLDPLSIDYDIGFRCAKDATP